LKNHFTAPAIILYEPSAALPAFLVHLGAMQRLCTFAAARENHTAANLPDLPDFPKNPC
jgi:hypothetical protein